MSGKRKREAPKPTEPIDVVDGIPDRSANRAPWKFALIVAGFLAWLAFLIYCHLAG